MFWDFLGTIFVLTSRDVTYWTHILHIRTALDMQTDRLRENRINSSVRRIACQLHVDVKYKHDLANFAYHPSKHVQCE